MKSRGCVIILLGLYLTRNTQKVMTFGDHLGDATELNLPEVICTFVRSIARKESFSYWVIEYLQDTYHMVAHFWCRICKVSI